MSDASKIRKLAAWFDMRYTNDPNPEVQNDLWRIAARLEAMDRINEYTEYLPSMHMTPEKQDRPGWPDSHWTGQDCPKCGSPFVARDKYGLYCCVCTWTDEKQKSS